MRRIATHLLLALFAYGQANAQEPGSVTRAPGGAMKVKLLGNIALNEKSTLTREWIAVHVGDLPVSLQGTPGVMPEYDAGGRYSSGSYRYKGAFTLIPTEPLAAFEIRILLFDVFGESIKTLSLTEVVDLPAGQPHKEEGTWSLLSENEASEFYASITYVARVRTASGKTLAANAKAVLDEARKFSTKFTADDLEPKKDPTKPPETP